MNKLKIGIIGSGFIAEHHVNAYRQIPGVDIVGISSIIEDQAKALMEKNGIRGNPIRDYQDLLRMGCDAVSI
ncbi:MAG: Gfo/Idh/MocA family oxidoreductase, partial [Promethearchaeota archaeon]